MAAARRSLRAARRQQLASPCEVAGGRLRCERKEEDVDVVDVGGVGVVDGIGVGGLDFVRVRVDDEGGVGVGVDTGKHWACPPYMDVEVKERCRERVAIF